MGKIFSSATDITEILKSKLSAINDVNKFIVDGKLDQAVLKNLQNNLTELEKVFKNLHSAAAKFQQIKLPNAVASKIFSFSLKAFLENISLITTGVNNIVISKNVTTNIKNLNTILESLRAATTNLVLIGKDSIKLIALKKPIIKAIEAIQDICKMLQNDFAIVNASGIKVINETIAGLGQTIKSFTVVGFLVPAAIIGLYLVKLFLGIFFKAFNIILLKDVFISIKTIKKISFSITLLCGAITLMALAGVIAIIAWKEILVTIAFIGLVITAFSLFALLLPLIQIAIRTPKLIAQTMLLLSTVIILWALTGQLIIEEWLNITKVMGFMLLAIGLFAILSLAMRLIKEGTNSIVKITISMLLLSFMVILWALTGGLVLENWANVLIMVAFVGVAIGLFMLLSFGTKFIKKGATGVILLSIAFALISAVALLMIYTGQQIEAKWPQLLIISAFVAAAIAIFVGLSFLLLPIGLGAVALGVMGAALLLFSLSVWALTAIAAKWNESYTDIIKTITWNIGCTIAKLGLLAIHIGLGAVALGIMGAALLIFAIPIAIFKNIASKWTDTYTETISNLIFGLGKQLSKLGLLAIPIGLGAAALVVMSAALIPFGISIMIIIKSLEKLLELNIDKTNAKDVLKTPIEIMYSTMKYASKIKLTDVLSGSFKIRALSSTAEGLSNIADTIQKYAELKVPDKFDKNGKPIGFHKMTPGEFELAAINIRKIITFLLETLSDEKTVSILENMSRRAVKNIGLILQNTAGVTNLIDAIEKAVKIDEKDIEKSIANIGSIIQQYIIKLQTLFIGTGEIIKEKGFFGDTYTFKINAAPIIDVKQIEDIVDSLEKVNKSIEPLKVLMEAIENIATPEETNVQKIGTALNAYVGAIVGNEKHKGLPIDITFNKKISNLSSLITQTERLAKIDTNKIQKNTETFSKFIDKANTINSNKIKSVRDMFEQMASFSKSIHGDFDKLADILSEKLVDVLDKLRGAIEESPNGNSTILQKNDNITQKNNKNENNNSLSTNQLNEKTSEKTDKNKNIKDILDSLEEITMVLKGVRENTENINSNY